MTERHRIKFTNGDSPVSARLLLDGHEIKASKFEFTADVNGRPIAVITIPAAILDLDANVVTQINQPLVTPAGK